MPLINMPPPDDMMLRTVADELLDLVKKSRKLSVEEAAKHLKMPLATVQAIVDFLVEERVFGIEYKFTTPYVYLYREGVKEAVKGAKGKEKSFTKELMSKERFYQKAKENNVPHEYIETLWRKYLRQNFAYVKEEFWRKAREKKADEGEIEGLWRKYISYL